MKVVLVGVGQAGGKLAERLAEFDNNMGFGAVLDAVAVNTARTDLDGLAIDTVLVGRDRVGGHGVGGDNELGAAVMQSDVGDVMDAVDARVTAKAEAILVVAGLGGGTGSGGAPVLAGELGRVYDRPVYALGVLPGRSEGSMYEANAGRSLVTLAREAETTLLVDNDAWHDGGESVGEAFEAINETIARRVGLLLAAGEAVEDVAESVVDTSEILNTLREGDLAALGYATAAASEDSAENVNAMASIVRKAFLTGTSVPDATTGEAALLVAAGRPDAIPRKGVERARSWLEEELGSMQVRGGDFPVESDRLAALVLVSGIEHTDRITEFLERARDAQAETNDANADAAADPVAQFQSDELEDLF